MHCKLQTPLYYNFSLIHKGQKNNTIDLTSPWLIIATIVAFVFVFVQLGSIADRTILEADKDNDGMISFSEFVTLMENVDVEQKMSIRFLH